MPEPISPNVEGMIRQYVDGKRFTSSNEVLIFAMNLFGEFDQRYHDQLGQSLRGAFKAIDNGEGIPLNGTKEIESFFADMMEANREQSQSQNAA